MAFIYGCGWEQNTALVQYDTPYSATVAGGAAKTISSSVRNTINGVGGKYSCRFSNSGANGANYYDLIFRSTGDADSNGPFYVRWYMRIDDTPAADCTLLDFYAIGGGTQRMSIILNTSGALELWDSNSQIGSDSSAINDAFFHRIEGQFSRSGASMTLTLLVDGVTAATGTTSDNVGGVGRIIFGMLAATSSYDVYWDDFALSDSAYPGAGVQIMLRPDGAGDTNDFSGGTGTTFAEFDEETPDDDTTYSTLATNNNTAFFTIDDPSVQGMGPSDTVNVVFVGYRWAAVDTSASNNIAGRIKSQASGTITTGSTGSTDDTSYQSNLGEAPAAQADKYYTVSATDPQAGGAWTRALLRTAQIGVIAADAAPDVKVTAIWALVDFLPITTDVADFDLTNIAFTGASTGTVDIDIPATFPAETDDYGYCYRTCTTSPVTQGAAGVTCVSEDGTIGTLTADLSGLIPGCTVSIAPYYRVGDATYGYGDTVTSGSTPTPSSTVGAAALAGLI